MLSWYDSNDSHRESNTPISLLEEALLKMIKAFMGQQIAAMSTYHGTPKAALPAFISHVTYVGIEGQSHDVIEFIGRNNSIIALARNHTVTGAVGNDELAGGDRYALVDDNHA